MSQRIYFLYYTKTLSTHNLTNVIALARHVNGKIEVYSNF